MMKRKQPSLFTIGNYEQGGNSAEGLENNNRLEKSRALVRLEIDAKRKAVNRIDLGVN